MTKPALQPRSMPRTRSNSTQLNPEVLFSAADIERFHRSVHQRLCTLDGWERIPTLVCVSLATPPNTPSKDEPWKGVGRDKDVVFGFDPRARSVVRVKTGKSNHGSAVALNPDQLDGERHTWVCWTDAWKRTPSDKFTLNALSLGFYVGPASWDAVDARWGIIRAEWDGSASKSAQPHWHVDPDLLVRPDLLGEWQPQSSTALPISGGLGASEGAAEFQSGLSEPPALPLAPIEEATLQESTDNTISLKRIHLGMAGWHHPNGEQPGNCWQHRIVGVELQDCVRWAKQTIAYMAFEMRNTKRLV